VLVSIGLYHIAKDSTVPLWAIFYVALASLITIYILIDAVRLALESRPTFPAVLAVLEPPAQSQLVLLTEASELFGIGTLVSVYYREPAKGFEILLAHGAVQTVQTDTKVQIKVEQWETGNDTVQTQIRQQEPDALGRLIIRPSVSRGRNTTDLRHWNTITAAILADYEEKLGDAGDA
jgi:hypothetical protein